MAHRPKRLTNDLIRHFTLVVPTLPNGSYNEGEGIMGKVVSF